MTIHQSLTPSLTAVLSVIESPKDWLRNRLEGLDPAQRCHLAQGIAELIYVAGPNIVKLSSALLHVVAEWETASIEFWEQAGVPKDIFLAY